MICARQSSPKLQLAMYLIGRSPPFLKRSYSSGNAGLPTTRHHLLSNDHRDPWHIMRAFFANGIKLSRTISNRESVQPFAGANIPRSELLWKIFSFAFFIKVHTHRPFICFRTDRMILIFEMKDKLGFILIRKISSSVNGGIHAEKSWNALDACSVETVTDANALERSLKAASFIHSHPPSHTIVYNTATKKHGVAITTKESKIRRPNPNTTSTISQISLH